MQHFHIFSLLCSVSVSIEIYYYIITCHGILLLLLCSLFDFFLLLLFFHLQPHMFIYLYYIVEIVNNKSVSMFSSSLFYVFLHIFASKVLHAQPQQIRCVALNRFSFFFFYLNKRKLERGRKSIEIVHLSKWIMECCKFNIHGNLSSAACVMKNEKVQ